MQTYYRDVTVLKLGHSQEKYKMHKLCRQPLAKLKLAKLTQMQIRKFPINIVCRVINYPSNDNLQHFYSQLQRWAGVKESFHTTLHAFASWSGMNSCIAEILAQVT